MLHLSNLMLSDNREIKTEKSFEDCLSFTLLQLDPSSPRLGRQLEHSPVVAALAGVHVQGVRVGEVLLLDRILALLLPAADM